MLCKTAATKIMVMSFVCFILAAKIGVSDLFLQNTFCVIRDEGHLRATEEVLVLPSRKIEANIIKWGLLTISNNCEASPVFALLVFDCANKIDWRNAETLGWYFYNLGIPMITVATKWKTDKSKRGYRGDALSSAVHLKVVSKYVEVFRESCMKHEFAEAGWNRFITKGVELLVTSSIGEQQAFSQDITSCREKAKVESDGEDDN